MLVYMLLVYTWGLWTYPLGRDYAAMASGGQDLPALANHLFALEMRLFGDGVVGYHLVNLVFLYACMIALYRFTALTVKGPAWLGIFAANLFMANPLHTESVLNLSGIGDLLPTLLALLALVAYAEHVERPNSSRLFIAFALLAGATLPYKTHAYLPVVFLLYEGLVTGSHRRSRWRIGLGALLLMVSLALHGKALAAADYDLAAMAVPLYFTIYCIGFLPENVLLWINQPWIGWLAASACIVVLGFIHRRARRPVFMFALLAMATLRLAPSDRAVDPVHLIGGGQLLLAQALFMVAVAALYLRIMEHPKWCTPFVLSSISVSIIFFAMEAVSIGHWREAGRQVQAFQNRATTLAEANPNQAIAVLPDFQYYRGAPMNLSESIAHDTPFSTPINHVALLPLHYEKGDAMKVSVEDWSSEGGAVVVTGIKAIRIAPHPYDLARDANQVKAPEASYTPTIDDTTTTFTIQPAGQALPSLWVPQE
jgi:hypothetical protein